jgi:hypothetical protein
MRKAVAAVGLFGMFLLTACGSSHRAYGVFAVEKGMTRQEVRSVAGTPRRAGPTCWLYRFAEQDTGINGMPFCFTGDHVSLIQTSHQL